MKHWQTKRVRYRGIARVWVLAFALVALSAWRWPWEGSPWPGSSDVPVERLDHPTVEELFAGRHPDEPYRFGVFGDQRALADGEFQEMIARIDGLPADRTVDFLVDTGDIVDNGSKSDQFVMLREILHPVRRLPYLVGVGNHELHDNKGEDGRHNAATFLSYLDPELGPDRLYYRKDIGPVTFLFLDTNDFTYGVDGERSACPIAVHPHSREAEQVAWIRQQVADLKGRDRTVIAAFHHPLVQSSDKHSDAAAALWNFDDRGDGIVDLLADAGTDVILVGHTHTFERFRLKRKSDGHTMQLVNISGRPRDAFLWIGSGDRRANDIRGEEAEWLGDRGWNGLEPWEITQEDFLGKDDEANQFAIFDVDPDGAIRMQPRFLDDDEPDGTRHGASVTLHSPVRGG